MATTTLAARRPRSFRGRVAGVAMATTFAGLALAFSIFITNEWKADRDTLARQRSVLGAVLAENLSASLVFGDPTAARGTLAALDRAPGFREARLFDASGRLFAEHRAKDAPPPPAAVRPSGSASARAWFEDGALFVAVPVKVDAERVGELVLVSGLEHLNRALLGYGAVALLAFAAATLAARATSLWLAGRVIEPVRRLSGAMARVRESGDFGGLVDRSGDDELAALADEFNALLRQLQANDDALRSSLAELVQARDAAEAANISKSQFLANMSHEIRTPLNGVLGMTQVMERDSLTDEQRRRLSVIRESGEALLTVLNDVLDISKIEAGKLELVSEAFDLEEVVASTMAAFAGIAASKNLAFELDVAEAAQGLWRGDPVRLRQIVGNLVSNALKFTDAGSVRVTAGADAEMIEIAVEDSGIGIPDDKLGSLFDKFSQVDGSATRRFGGTGLGLAICRELSQLMGGSVSVESTEGRGSCFRLRLPLERVTIGSDEAVAKPAPEHQPAVPSEPLRILAAEDNAVNQLVLKSLIEPLGVELTTVGDGRAAVEAWARGSFDLILMDVQMPGMDGADAARAIREIEARERRRRTPILALSANAMKHQVEAYLAAGMDDHVAKPIEIEKLYAAIEAALQPAKPTQAA